MQYHQRYKYLPGQKQQVQIQVQQQQQQQQQQSSSIANNTIYNTNNTTTNNDTKNRTSILFETTTSPGTITTTTMANGNRTSLSSLFIDPNLIISSSLSATEQTQTQTQQQQSQEQQQYHNQNQNQNQNVSLLFVPTIDNNINYATTGMTSHTNYNNVRKKQIEQQQQQRQQQQEEGFHTQIQIINKNNTTTTKRSSITNNNYNWISRLLYTHNNGNSNNNNNNSTILYTIGTTIIGSLTFLIYQVVFCITFGATIHYSGCQQYISTLYGTKLACIGIILAGPIFISNISQSIPALYPSCDLFLAPFIADLASYSYNELLKLHSTQQYQSPSQQQQLSDTTTTTGIICTDIVYMNTFLLLLSCTIGLSGILCIIAAKFHIASIGLYLPYSVLCGFFATTGLLLYNLGFYVDTGTSLSILLYNICIWIINGCTNSTHDDNPIHNLIIAIQHHIPSLLIGILMHISGRQHPLYVIVCVILTIVGTYCILWLTGTTHNDAMNNNWFYSITDFTTTTYSSDSTSGISATESVDNVNNNSNNNNSHWYSTILSSNNNYNQPIPFSLWISLLYNHFNNSTSSIIAWDVVFACIPRIISLAVLYLIRCSLHAAAVKKNIPFVTTTTTKTKSKSIPVLLTNNNINNNNNRNVDVSEGIEDELHTFLHNNHNNTSIHSAMDNNSEREQKQLQQQLQTEEVEEDNGQYQHLITPRSRGGSRTVNFYKNPDSNNTNTNNNNNNNNSNLLNISTISASEVDQKIKFPMYGSIIEKHDTKNRNGNTDSPTLRIDSCDDMCNKKNNNAHILNTTTTTNTDYIGNGTNANNIIFQQSKQQEVSSSSSASSQQQQQQQQQVSASSPSTPSSVPVSSLNYILEYGYGYSQIVSALVGGLAIVPSISASSTLSQLGAGGLAPQYGSCILLIYFYITDFTMVQYIPKPAFSCLLVLASIDLCRTWLIGSYTKTKDKIEWCVTPLLVLLTFTVGILNAIVIGICTSMFIFVVNFYKTGTVKFVGTGLSLRSTVERGLYESMWLDHHSDSIRILVLQNYLFFGNIQSVSSYVTSIFVNYATGTDTRNQSKSAPNNNYTCSNHINQQVPTIPPKPKYLIIDFTLVTGIDTSATDLLHEVIDCCRLHNCSLFFAGLSTTIRSMLSYNNIRPLLYPPEQPYATSHPGSNNTSSITGNSNDTSFHRRTSSIQNNRSSSQYARKQKPIQGRFAFLPDLESALAKSEDGLLSNEYHWEERDEYEKFQRSSSSTTNKNHIHQNQERQLIGPGTATDDDDDDDGDGDVFYESGNDVNNSSTTNTGFMYALQKIDEQHGLRTTIDLIGLQRYVQPAEILKGDVLFRNNNNNNNDDMKHGIYFVETGLLRVQLNPTSSSSSVSALLSSLSYGRSSSSSLSKTTKTTNNDKASLASSSSINHVISTRYARMNSLRTSLSLSSSSSSFIETDDTTKNKNNSNNNSASIVKFDSDSTSTIGRQAATVWIQEQRKLLLNQNTIPVQVSVSSNYNYNMKRRESRIARIGQGWVISSIDAMSTSVNGIQQQEKQSNDNSTTYNNNLTHVAVTDCQLHYLSYNMMQQLEQTEPYISLQLYKLLSLLATKRQETTIQQLEQFVSIMTIGNTNSDSNSKQQQQQTN